MTTAKGIGKTQVCKVVGCVYISIKVIAASVVVGWERIIRYSRAARDRVKSIVGGCSCKAVTVLQRMGCLFAIDVDGMDRGGSNGYRRDRSRGHSWTGRGDQFVGKSSASMEVLLGHLGLEHAALFRVDLASIEDIDSL